MSAKTLAWISAGPFGVTLLVSVGGFAFLIGQQREMVNAFHADELLMTSVELIALESVESGDMNRATMIQSVFVGLTRLQPKREELSARQRQSIDDLVRRWQHTAHEIRNTSLAGKLGGSNDWMAGLPLFQPSDA